MKLTYLLHAGLLMVAASSSFGAVTINCPTEILVDCTNAAAPVNFTVTARNDAGQDVPVICSPASGTVFGLGLHRVVCSAADGRETATCTFFVEVEDTVPPVLSCPSNLVVQATSAQGAIVDWRASATDNCGPASTVTCVPPSGSVFPVGRTSISCVASDAAGNSEQCAFLVTALSPAPLRISQSESNDAVILQWTGNQALQETPELRPGSPWQDSTLPVTDDNGELSVNWRNDGLSHFFRLRAVPFPDTRDTDGDGVPDSRDRCPGTPPGTLVDAFGCAVIDVVRAPEALLGPVRKPWTQATLLLANIAAHTNPPFASADLSAVMRHTDLAQAGLTRALEDFSAGELCPGSAAYDSAMTAWSTARVALEVLMREVMAEWESRPPRSSEEGDVHPEEGYLANLEDLQAALAAGFDAAQTTLPAVQGVCRAVVDPNATARGRVVQVNDAERLVKLDSGVSIILPTRDLPGNFAEGVLVDFSGYRLDDGSLIGRGASGEVLASPDVLYLKTVFRIAPIQPFPPEGSGPYTFHYPEAYHGIGQKLTLESDMRLGAVSIGGYSDGPQSTDSLKLELRYENENSGLTTLLAASALKPGDAPVKIPSFLNNKLLLGDEWIVVTVQRKNPTNNALEIVSTTNIPVRIVLRGGVCWANFDRTEFELVEANDYGDLDITFVESITKNMALFRPPDQGTTPVFEFRSLGNLREDDDTFFVFNDLDSSGFDPGIFNDGSTYQKGVNYPVGSLTWPRLRGKHNQRTFWYSVRVFPLVRDRVSNCNGVADSYYKLPMSVGWPTWTMGQGNLNPGFTHCPGCYNQFAFDFIAPQNTSIRAARGGTVLSFIESRSQNCWNAQTSSCTQNCPGANRLKILHQDGTVGIYMHMPQNSINLNVNQRVFRGGSIAIVGNVGCSSTPHLHFQVDPVDGAALSMQISFEAEFACAILQPPFLVPCGIRECYIPNRNDILFSTQ